MLTLLLLLAAPVDPTAAMMKTASAKLHAGCVGDACAPVVKPSPYRIGDDADGGPTIKDQAFRDDGGKCSVVGARVCTGKPRTMLRAELDR